MIGLKAAAGAMLSDSNANVYQVCTDALWMRISVPAKYVLVSQVAQAMVALECRACVKTSSKR